MKSVPVRAAISESVTLTRQMGKSSAAGLVNAVLRRAAAYDLTVEHLSLIHIYEQFEEKIDRGEMLEYVNYCGKYYGTPKSEVDARLDRGTTVVLDVYKRQSVDRAIGMLPDMVDKITALFNNKQKEQQAQGEARPAAPAAE